MKSIYVDIFSRLVYNYIKFNDSYFLNAWSNVNKHEIRFNYLGY